LRIESEAFANCPSLSSIWIEYSSSCIDLLMIDFKNCLGLAGRQYLRFAPSRDSHSISDVFAFLQVLPGASASVTVAAGIFGR
jgi:hypothetical protein